MAIQQSELATQYAEALSKSIENGQYTAVLILVLVGFVIVFIALGWFAFSALRTDWKQHLAQQREDRIRERQEDRDDTAERERRADENKRESRGQLYARMDQSDKEAAALVAANTRRIDGNAAKIVEGEKERADLRERIVVVETTIKK